MTGKLEELVDVLFNTVQDAKSMPFSSEKCVLEREKMIELIDEIRTAIPAEVSEAQMLVSARADYIAGAKREAEAIKQVAEEEAAKMATQEEIYELAVKKSREMIAAAEAKSKELRNSAGVFVEQMMKNAEDAVMQSVANLRQVRNSFHSSANRAKENDEQAAQTEETAED